MTRIAAAGASIGLLLVSTFAQAQQVFESTGNRALGMGGAFVGASSDPSAVWWNPGGMAVGGPPAPGMTIGWVRFQTGNPTGAAAAGPTLRESTFYSLGNSPLALSYGRLQTTDLYSAADGTLTGETLKTSQFGLTFMQSLAPGLLVGTTVKLLRGFAASGPSPDGTATDALKAGEALSGDTVNRFDYDVGVMVTTHHFRAGATLKNLQQPSFPTSAGTAIILRRQARVGVAVLPTSGLTLAMDLDLDRVDLRGGLRQMIAFGGEDIIGRQFAIRGGIRWSVTGERQRVGSVGVSYQLKKGYWLDGQYTRGDLDGDRGFGVTLRAGF